MRPKTARMLRALFWAYVGWTFLHIAYVVNHEPFSFDAWNVAVDTGAKSPSIARFFSFWHQQYTQSNPRIGQPIAYLAYKIPGFAEIVTPTAFLAIVVAGFVIGTGRLPSRKNDRDLATLTVGIGFLWFVAPNMPAYMFCRAYATNYIYTAALQLSFVAALRLHAARGDEHTPIGRLVGLFVLGVVCGMGNEHVGPTMILFTLGYCLWTRRKHARNPVFAWVGLAGLVIGYALLFFAPGQNHRYEGLAERYTVVQQVLVRGIAGNLDIFRNLLEAAAPVLLLMVGAIGTGFIGERRSTEDMIEARREQRSALTIVAVAIGAASLITMTVFASPLLGPRFYMHSMFLLLASMLGVVAAFLYRPKTFAPFVVLAVIASGYATARTIPFYTRVSRDSDRRLAELEATPRGGVYTAQGWEQIGENWWTLGDDVRDQKKQEMVAKYFDLRRVLFRGNDLWKTLGVTDVKLTMQYEFAKPICLDEVEQLDLKPYVGRDVAALHHAFLDAIAEIERVTGQKLEKIDLVATFLGDPPPLPRSRIYVARWDHGVLEGYTAGIKRIGRSKDRQILFSPELKKANLDIYIDLIGDPPKLLGKSGDDKPLVYQPWRRGPYWVLACKADACFVVFTATHTV